MSSEEEDPVNNDLVTQITGNPEAIANLSQALIPTLLSSLQGTKDGNGPGSQSQSNSQSQGEQDRQFTNGNYG